MVWTISEPHLSEKQSRLDVFAKLLLVQDAFQSIRGLISCTCMWDYKMGLSPYSGKLLREKTFANLAVLWLFAKVFSVKFGACHYLAAPCSEQSMTAREHKNGRLE